MLRLLTSRQMAEVYAFNRIECNPVDPSTETADRAAKLRSSLSKASNANAMKGKPK